MITITINGQEIQAEEGQTVLEVAKANGIEIPTLCYHPLLEPYGGCRLCIVEIVAGGRPGLQTSCTYPAEEGLEVLTRSPSVIEARKMVLGLLLSRTPNVEVIQDLAREYGITEPPFPTDTPDERCILCGQCVRTCNDLVKAHVLNFSERGIERLVGPPFLEKTRQCIGCGACTIMCPTGAIEIALEEAGVYQAKPLGPASAIYVPSLQAIPLVPVIDTDSCIRFRQNDRTEGEVADACEVCQLVCEADAINFDQEDEIIELDVGAIIVATGFEMWDPIQLSQYSYGKSPNIITGLEFERLSNSGGITAGEILTAEGEKPERVAIPTVPASAACTRSSKLTWCATKPAPRYTSSTWICVPLAMAMRSSMSGCRKRKASPWYAAVAPRYRCSQTANCASRGRTLTWARSCTWTWTW